jgi:aminoglycoside 6'-N-acetyltransferase I
MDISPITSEDMDEWLAMRRALYTGLDDAFHRREMDVIVTSREMTCFIGRLSGGEVCVGMIELSLRNVVDGCLNSPVGYIEGLYIKPELRGRGFGRQLVAFAESWFIRNGCREMATDAELDNSEAQAFFRQLRFSETWRVVEFKKDIGA